MPLTSGGTSTQTQAEVRTTELVSQDQLGCTGQQQSRIDMQQAHVAGQALSGAEAGAETADTETERERSSFVLPPAMSSGTCAETQPDERTTKLASGDQMGFTGQRQATVDMQQPAGSTGAKRQRVHPLLGEGGQDDEADATMVNAAGQTRAEQLASAGLRQGKIDMQQAEGGSDTKRRRVQQPIADDDLAKRDKDSAPGDQLGSKSQRPGSSDMQPAAGGSGAQRQRTQQQLPAGGQDLEAEETMGATGGPRRAKTVKPALACDTGKAAKELLHPTGPSRIRPHMIMVPDGNSKAAAESQTKLSPRASGDRLVAQPNAHPQPSPEDDVDFSAELPVDTQGGAVDDPPKQTKKKKRGKRRPPPPPSSIDPSKLY